MRFQHRHHAHISGQINEIRFLGLVTFRGQIKRDDLRQRLFQDHRLDIRHEGLPSACADSSPLGASAPLPSAIPTIRVERVPKGRFRAFNELFDLGVEIA